MEVFREKFHRAGYFFFGGIIILLCWALIIEDYRAVIFSGENIESIPGGVLELLFQYYLIPILGGSFCLIGFMGFVILGVRYYRERV